MACDRYRLVVERSVDSGFPASMLAGLQAHARHCVSCAEDLERTHSVLSKLREDTSVDAPTDLQQRVMDRIGAVNTGLPAALPMPSGAILPAPVPEADWIAGWKLLAGIVIGSALGAVVVTAF